MRRFVLLLLVLPFFLAISGIAQEQRIDWDKAHVKVQKISANVYLLQGVGGNIGAFVSNDGLVLIDCEELQMGPKIEAALKAISDKPVKYVLNTHWHGDHTGGNAYFGKTAIIIAHDNMRKKMATAHDPRITDLGVSLPAMTFSDQLTLHMNSGEIHAMHFEHGHTDGDAVVFFPQDNVVLTGDIFTNFNPPHFPAIDTDNDGSGGPQGAIAAAEYILAHTPDDVRIIPGHGGPATKTELTKYLAVLKDTTAALQAGINQRKSLDQLKQENVLAKWAYLDSNVIPTNLYIERLYHGLVPPMGGEAPAPQDRAGR
jgi:glyoxylase-like metal-dependent hydrolase (beta-lactamase superfamily II)